MVAKKIVLGLVVFMWLGIALALVYSRHAILVSGTKIMLKTEPMDPRDMLRGDYVVLRYPLSTLDLTQIRTQKRKYRNLETVYVTLAPGGAYWDAVEVSSLSPRRASGNVLFIRGKVQSCYAGSARVTYGIENYFVPEGKGRLIEQNMRLASPEPVSVEVSIDRSGTAIISRLFMGDRPVNF